MSKHSYQRASFTEFELEEQRLKRQAEIATAMELQVLIRSGLHRTGRVLDLGCGQGQIAAAVCQYLSGGTVTGLDINTDFISTARENYKEHNLVFKEGSAYQLDELPAFDFIYSRLLFQHLSAPSLAIEQIWKKLTYNGRCCIIDVNDDWFFLSPSLPEFDTLVRSSAWQQRAAGGNRHIAAELPLLLRQAGFRHINVEIIPFSSLQVGIQSFLDITLSFRVNQAPKLAPFYDQILNAVSQKPDAFWGVMGVFVVTAVKPVE